MDFDKINLYINGLYEQKSKLTKKSLLIKRN